MHIEEKKVTSEELQSNTAAIMKKFFQSDSRKDLNEFFDFMDDVDAEALKVVMESSKPKVRDDARILSITSHSSLADSSTNKETKDVDQQINMRIK